MSTLFMIGNGFDLNCGMKTSYKDVYRGYVKEKSDSNLINQFKKDISADIDNWSDFEMALARYAGKFRDENELLECCRDFNVYMSKYLNGEMEKFQNIYNLNKDKLRTEFLGSLTGFYKGVSHNVDNIMKERKIADVLRTSAISFNYTRAFDLLFSDIYKNIEMNANEIIHLHGVLSDDPVLGIDNENQLNTTFPLSKIGKRSFLKPVFNENYDSERVRRAKLQIASSSTICCFGLSMGESDLTWRNEIINWLNENINHHLFLYQYKLSSIMFRTADEKMDKEDDEKEKLLAEWGVTNEELLDQIHIPCGRNIFNIEKKLMEEKTQQGDIDDISNIENTTNIIANMVPAL